MPDRGGVLFFHTGRSDLAPGGECPGCERILAARSLVGGKGASLHALSVLGYRVPPGFTIPVAWCEAYHAAQRALPSELRLRIAAAIERLEDLTGKSLRGGPGGLRVAVRSGAAESMPGMMDTVLDVDSLPAIEAAVERVFLSWMSDRAVAYRRAKGITGLAGTAVTVQEMCPAEAAGVAFTMDPESGEDAVIIEAVPGLGESLVSGAVTPHRLRFARAGLEMRPAEGNGSEPILSLEAAREVARLALEVEERFGFPVDVEWAIARGEVHFLQARALRLPGEGPALRAVLLREVDILLAPSRASSRPAAREARFIRHNLDETLSYPTPLTWDLLRGFLRGPHGLLGLYRDLGFRPSRRVLERGFLALIGGRIHAECGLASEVFFGSDLLRHDVEAVLRNPAALDEPPGLWNMNAATPGKALRVLVHALLSARRIRRLRASFLARFEGEVLPEWTAWCRERGRRDLSPLAASELLAEIDDRIERVFGSFPREALKLSFLAGLAHSELLDFLERRLGEDEGRRRTQALVGAAAGGPGLEQNRAVERLARAELDLESFLTAHGHRGSGEMDLARPRWREDPRPLALLIEALRARGAEPREEESHERERRDGPRDEPGLHEKAIVQRLEACEGAGGPVAVEMFHERLHRARELLPWRETWKHHWMFGLDLVRHALLELDRRLGADGQVFYLELEELRAIVLGGGKIDDEARERIRRRREEERVARSLDLPDLVTPALLEAWASGRRVDESEPERAAGALEGTPLASGSGTGKAWICAAPDAPPPDGGPYVLVCRTTDPGWTPLLVHARALVVERGGTLSHGAIVCRDLGVPAVVLAEATRRIVPGEELRVDGSLGTVERGAERRVERKGERREDRPEARGGDEGIPPEPWVGREEPRLGLRAAAGLAAALAGSVLILGIPAAGDALLTVISPALEWTIEAGLSPFLSIASAAALSAVASTILALLIVDRGRLRRMRERLAWYRRELRKLRGAPLDQARMDRRAATRLKLDRRRRQAAFERGLELLRPIGWSFLPFCLAYLWIQSRFLSETIEPATVFTLEAFFEPAEGDRFLRFARLDVEDPRKLRLLDEPYRPVEPNLEEPHLGPYHATWSLEAVEEVHGRMAVTARGSRRGIAVHVARGHGVPGPAEAEDAGTAEIPAIRIRRPPRLIELPGPIFEGLSVITRWITGGREITPRQAASGPAMTFIVLAVVFTLLLQRLAGLR